VSTAWTAVALAALTALLVRFDARAVGPYFAFYEVLPGMGITEAVLRGEERPVRLAVVRRFGYAFLVGLVLAYVFDAPFVDAVGAGVLIGVLLVWPLTVQGLPRWAAPVRTLLLLYFGVVVAFTASAALGHLFVEFVAEGDPIRWLQQEGLRTLASVVAAAFALTAIALVPRSAR
jgi:hypothetical protein